MPARSAIRAPDCGRCAPFQGKEQRNEKARLAGRRKRASMLNMCLTGRMPAIEKSMSDPEIQQRRAGRLCLAREDC